ncbi:L,D-transpeptidase [Demequina sp. SYSU T00192]|uniref:L,D-transpeptidase n=1 Tax=Demequina litoralis TaxID=3051660 RepID=A0ABT8GAX9_9MICO|nr:L,D-transpeptidase [Demequina sp. SYSU T00192]MDN4476294.1 L,D-transpeptidase [Demequina sp. SYSU T00192]
MRRIVALLTMVGALALSACTPAAEPAAPPSASSTAVAVAPSETATAEAEPSPSESVDATLSYIATARGTKVTVLKKPDGATKTVIEAADVLTVPDQTPLTFLVKEIQGSWLEVYLPIRPNGSTGWVSADDVSLAATHMSVEIDMEAYELTVWDGEEAVLTTEIGLGTDELPTPGGVYYVRELLQPPDPDGLYGPYAYGLSGYSPVLDEFAGGDAVIGLHGTNDPDSFGRSVSHGCIRVPNDVITEMVEAIGIPLGTPVYIDEA